MALLDQALQLALQRMLDGANEPMMIAAENALRNGGVAVYWGKPHGPASELAATFRLRLDNVDRFGIDILGLPEAILSLDQRGSDPVDVVMIYGVDRDYLLSFVDEDRLPVACISLPSITGQRSA